MVLQRVNECFTKTFSQRFGLDLLTVSGSTVFKQFNTEIRTNYTGISSICEGITEIEKCLGDSVIQNCVNVEDFMRVPFVKSQVSVRQNARYYLTMYFISNYGCNKGLQSRVFVNSFQITVMIVPRIIELRSSALSKLRTSGAKLIL